MKKIGFIGLLAALTLVGCAAPSDSAEPVQRRFFAMDTEMNLSIYADSKAAAEDVLDKAEAEVNRLDALLSRQDQNSAIAAVNASCGAEVAVDAETMGLLKTAAGYSEMTDGAFSITVAPIMDAWNFTGDNPRIPARDELDTLLEKVGDGRIAFGSSTVTLEEGMAVDLGGIAKGYASDCLAALLDEAGISSAIVNLGGNTYVHGTKPDGSLWRVAVVDPNDTAAYLGVLSLSDRFIITSGGYQRYFEQDGVTYYHIIDPKDGDVARSGLTSVTVVCESGTMGDALSTALFVMGYDRAVDFWNTSGLEFDMILADENGNITLTEGLQDCFDPSLAEHDYEYTYIEKN